MANKADPSAIANNVKTVLRYGADNPYGEIETEESIKNIQRQDLVDYYQQHVKPNVAYLAVVGDITVAEARRLSRKVSGRLAAGRCAPNENLPYLALSYRAAGGYCRQAGGGADCVGLHLSGQPRTKRRRLSSGLPNESGAGGEVLGLG